MNFVRTRVLNHLFSKCFVRRCSAKKVVWERTQNTIHRQKQFKLIFKSIFNELFPFNALKKHENSGNAFLHPK